MRWIMLILCVVSFNAYSKNGGPPYLPCLDSWEDSDYVVCPLLTTAIPFATTILLPILGTEYTGESTVNNKVIIDAIPSAASYVASNGEIHSAYLEQALIIARKEYPNASDMELAKAILAY